MLRPRALGRRRRPRRSLSLARGCPLDRARLTTAVYYGLAVFVFFAACFSRVLWTASLCGVAVLLFFAACYGRVLWVAGDGRAALSLSRAPLSS